MSKTMVDREREELEAKKRTAGLLGGLPSIFRDLVDRHTTRFDLRTPWGDGSHVYATDGCIIARIPIAEVPGPTLEMLPDPKLGRWPSAGKMADWGKPYSTEALELPAIEPMEPICPECGGHGYLRVVRCRPCDGAGCDLCEYEGYDFPEECDACDGTGLGIPTASHGDEEEGFFSIGLPNGQRFHRYYLGLLAKHRASAFGLDGDDPKRPLRFTVAGGVEGLLMPVHHY
jgi:hypothetical protein